MGSPKKHVGRIAELIAKIQERRKEAGPVDSAVSSVFTELFCRSLPRDDLSRTYDAVHWANLACEAESFITVFPKNTPYIVRISEPKRYENEGAEYSVVEILSDDRPFLVDSITEELTKYNIEKWTISHPVYVAERDADGVLKALRRASSEKSDETDDKLESYQHYHITPIHDASEREALKSELEDILDTVSLVVKDWPDMLHAIKDTRSSLDTSIAAYRSRIHEDERALYDNASTEAGEFLTWLHNANFVFLGYARSVRVHDEKFEDDENSTLGLMRCPRHDPGVPRGSLPKRAVYEAGELSVVEITKTDQRSVVHRPVHMDCVTVRLFDEDGRTTEERRFIGMFTSVVYYQSATLIPLIREKIKAVAERAGLPANSHDAKALQTVMEAFPRDELFQIRPDQLFETAMGITGLSMRPRVRLFLRKDELERYFSCIVFVPRDRMSTTLRMKIEHILTEALNGTVSNHYTQISESAMARIQIIIKISEGGSPDLSNSDIENDIENKIALVTHNWEDNLTTALAACYGDQEGRRLARRYTRAFPEDYSGRFAPDIACDDIKTIESLIASDKKELFRICRSVYRQRNVLELKIFRMQQQIPLSEMLPIVGHLGVTTIDAFTYPVSNKALGDTAWIHVLRLEEKHSDAITFDELRTRTEDMLERIRLRLVSDDMLNALVMQAGLHWRQVVLLRAYTKYLKQARFRYSRDFIQMTLLKYPEGTLALLELFDARFNPERESEDYEAIRKKTVGDLERVLSTIKDNTEDRVFRALLELISATQRTNFYVTENDGTPKDYVSFKLFSRDISFLPKPRPYAEIYVYATRCEGIHLRGGKVARGGLRWSDRMEDFRTEVLGLMKAQMTKNSVIIPVGSKGGFIVKRPPKDRDAWLEEGKNCYRTFLRGLLDVTDNISGSDIIAPDHVVRRDDDDPYLVVAADKGTATFSDIANEISAEYGFWLGDAFASGGSVGYDHKKMGITARGAWISVQRHFREAGIDVQKDPVTVIGVGDMAGDVFGNGMLLSRSLKLVAAFNHLHIFIDPDPDPEASFVERERMFRLPRSSWADYNPDLISEGGGVFERSAKSIKLSKQIQALIQTQDAEMAPEALIRALLLAPSDLLWNGGIGTYVKAKTESHEDVGDRANDALRVNGADLRCKVIGEGGNLGLTQLGRIEYALAGGRINTDAIDNSAGVDCSDHEVNIKILLGRVQSDGRIQSKERDDLLESMTDEVGELVLTDNVMQTQALTIAELQAPYQLEALSRLIDYLEQRYTLDREVEFLPSKEDITRRQFEQKGLTRPELAVTLAYAKLFLYENLLATDLPDNPYHEDDLIRYFPEKIKTDYTGDILEHPLRREIIATVITNSVINRVGSAAFFRLLEGTGADVSEISNAYIVIRDVFDLRTLWTDIEGLAGKVSAETKAMLFTETQSLIQRVAPWLISRHEDTKDIAAVIELYHEGIVTLRKKLPDLLPPEGQKRYDERYKSFVARGVPKDVAANVASLNCLMPATDIVAAASTVEYPLTEVAKIYYVLGERLGLRRMREYLLRQKSAAYWQQISAQSLSEELYQEQARIAVEAIRYFCSQNQCDTASLPEWEKSRADQLKRYDRFVEEMKSQEEEINMALIIVLLRKLKEIGA